MSDTLLILPVWKKGASAEDWFSDMANFARKYPERFRKMVLVYDEDIGNDQSRIGYYCHACSTTEAFGLLAMGQQRVWEFTTSGN